MTSLQSLTSSLGSLLILLGVAAFYGANFEDIKALIPSFFGVCFVIFGLLARKESLHDYMMRASLGFSLLGALIGLPGVWDLIGMLSGKEVEATPSSYGRIALFLMCSMYIAASIKNRKKKIDTGS